MPIPQVALWMDKGDAQVEHELITATSQNLVLLLHGDNL